jgi:hypothetical protein
VTWPRRHWQAIALTAWSALWFALLAPGKHNRPAGGGIAWRPFLAAGARLLFRSRAVCPPLKRVVPGGLHLYAHCPQLQIGPLSFVIAAPIRFLGPHSGLVAAEVLISVLGLATLFVLRQIIQVTRAATVTSIDAADPLTDWAFVAGGAIFIVGWQELAVAYAHLDDGLVLLLAALGTWAAIRGRPVLAGLAIGLAVDAKPWALALLPVLLLAAGLTAWRTPHLAARPVRASIRPCLIAVSVAAAVVLAGWLPFLLADPGTSAAFHYKIINEPDSALRALGVATATTPPWDRGIQIVAGCSLGVLAIWRGRWPALILLGVGARIALDPATHSYYTAGILAGALLWDLLGSKWKLPFWTLISYLALDIVPLATRDADLRGLVRLLLVTAFTAVIVLGPARWCWQPHVRAARTRTPGLAGL